MNTVFLGLGGNLGDRMQNLSLAVDAISRNVGEIQFGSSIYETGAWGNTGQADFLNCVISVLTDLNPIEVLHAIQKIETDLGRIRISRWAPRTMDIDILFYKDEICNSQDLTIPHPLIEKRRFVLLPMTEIAPYYIHPVLKKNMKELTVLCDDQSEVKKLNDIFNNLE